MPALLHASLCTGHRRSFSAYSCSCCTNPKLGSADRLLDLTYWIACEGEYPYSAIRYAHTTDVLLLTPSTQWTSTRAAGSRSASRRNTVVPGSFSTSSAKGRSSRSHCRCCTRMLRGTATWPHMAERTCVMPRERRCAGFSAKARSETYSLGKISEALGARRA